MCRGLHNIHYPAHLGLAVSQLRGGSVGVGQSQLHLSYSVAVPLVNPHQSFQSGSASVEQNQGAFYGARSTR